MTILASLCLFLLFFGGVRLDFGEDLTIKRPVLEITTCESPIAAGPVLVDRNGVHEDHYIVVSGGLENNELLVPSKKSFSIGYGTTAFLAKACVREFGPDIYSRFYLLGKTIQYTVDLSYCSCGCNMALYLVSMPGCHPGDAGDYYCDANGLTGQWCPELDLMEANKAALHVAAHACYSRDKEKCSWNRCDINGQYFNFYKEQEQWWARLDKNYPINVSNSFIVDKNDNLVQITTKISQGKEFVERSNVDKNYMGEMTEPLKEGMVLTMSFWGGQGWDMEWLDVPPCNPSEACDGSRPVPIAGLKIYDN